MKRVVENWPLEKLSRERESIAFPEYQREKNLWPKEKKELLIDSILSDIDIPKLYFNRVSKGHYEVIDGQQRLWSIWQYLDNGFTYAPEGEPGAEGRKFSQLTAAQRNHIKDYEVQVTVFDGADDDYLRRLFVRLQLGLLLNTGEKLNAAKGAMKDLVFSSMAEHEFVKKLGIPDRRFAKPTLCAQICINSFARAKTGTFARTRYDDLIQFLGEYESPQGKDLDFFRLQTKNVVRVLDSLRTCFGDDAKRLKNRSYILSVYLLWEDLRVKSGVLDAAKQKRFADFVLKLWGTLRDEIKLGMDRKNKDLYSFESLLSSAPGEKYQIERRHERLGNLWEYYLRTNGKIMGVK